MHIYTTKVNIGICFSVPISYLDRDAVRYWSTHFFFFFLQRHLEYMLLKCYFSGGSSVLYISPLICYFQANSEALFCSFVNFSSILFAFVSM